MKKYIKPDATMVCASTVDVIQASTQETLENFIGDAAEKMPGYWGNYMN